MRAVGLSAKKACEILSYPHRTLYDITEHTTFGVPARCRWFREYSSLKELKSILRDQEMIDAPIFHIGAGSNLLFADDFPGLVLHSKIKGIQRYDKDSETVYVIAGAGERWSDLVDWCVDNGLAGMENMSHIPGEVGASPIQNVGAYGVEAKDVIHSVQLYDTITGREVTFTNEDCHFSYRSSIFKHEAKGRYFVLRVSFRLKPSVLAEHLDYGPLKKLAERDGDIPVTIREVRDEVEKIRRSKLPEPEDVGSAGSFFTNPVMPRAWFDEVVAKDHPDIPVYPVEGRPEMVKLPAGWLVEHSGLKGCKKGGAEVWPKQCLVLANTGGATAEDVISLSDYVCDTVHRHFNVLLRPEVNIISRKVEVTVLGSGTSKGVPEAHCSCSTCTSTDPRDKRLRASVLVKAGGINILVDPGPDFRQQALRADIKFIDAVLLTHSHYDHVGGIDDLRPYCLSDSLPIYCSEDVYNDLHRRLDYAFRSHLYPGVPKLELRKISDQPFKFDGVWIQPINVMHAKLPIFGFRVGDFAYITDAKEIDPEELDKLDGVDTMIVNALRPHPHFSHFNIEEALGFISKVAPKQAYLTHMSHDMPPQALVEPKLPQNVKLAYDTLNFTVG